MPKPDQLLLPASVVGIVAGATLLVATATATSAVAPPLRTAPFTSLPSTTTTTAVATTTAPTVTAEVTTTTEPPPPTTTVPSPIEQVVDYALSQRGHPYRKGAAGPSAFDCSGLTSAAFAAIGVDLPHYSVTQAGMGRAVDWRHEPIEPGDLVFTRGDKPVIDLGHVGLAISATEWVVATRPGVPVRVAPLPAGIQRVRRIVTS